MGIFGGSREKCQIKAAKKIIQNVSHIKAELKTHFSSLREFGYSPGGSQGERQHAT